MKICLLSGSFYPRVGGAETYARTIAESMARAGHNIIIAADGTGSDAFQPDHLGPIRILRTSAYLPELINPDNQP